MWSRTRELQVKQTAVKSQCDNFVKNVTSSGLEGSKRDRERERETRVYMECEKNVISQRLELLARKVGEEEAKVSVRGFWIHKNLFVEY